MDEELRKTAQSTIENARKLERKRAGKDVIVAEYLKGIHSYLQISNKSLPDFYALSEAYYYIATVYFNAGDYAKSAENYLMGINQVLQTELNDEGYRKLTELYIDLADACYELYNKQAGDDAMANAIKAFGFIKIKTSKEQEIGDPTTNFKKFHTHYEKRLSTSSYISSAKFTNHEHLLGEGQFARKQEKELFEQFENISIGDIQQIDNSIEYMLSQLSVSAEKQLFSPVSISLSSSDGAYRDMAMQFLRLAQSHIQNKLISEAVATYRQAINTLIAIKEPKESDRQIIKNLQDQIAFLNKKSNHSESHITSTVATTHRHHQRTASVAITGFFGQAPAPSTKEEEEDLDEEMDVSSDYNGMYM